MRLKRSARTGSKSAPSRRVVFVVQWLETFEIVAPVVRALRDADCDVSVVVTPVRYEAATDGRPHWGRRGASWLRRRWSSWRGTDRDGAYDLAFAERTWKAVKDHGFEPEPLVPAEAEADRLRDLEPAAVFLPTPYEAHRHQSLDPRRLGLAVHYVDYAFNISPTRPGIDFQLPFFRVCDTIYAENDYCAHQFVKAGVQRSRLAKTGPPALDHWDVDRGRADVPTILWCPYWQTSWHGADEHTVGYSTFIPSYPAVLDEAARRPHMRFIIRTHPSLWAELRREALWSKEDELRFHARVAELENVTLGGDASPTTRYPLSDSHLEQFEQAWAMVTDGISFLAEFGYTGKPILLTQAPGNPGWNPVGQAIADVVQRSEFVQGLPTFLDQVERDFDPDADKRREVIRGLFYRPPGGSAAAIARHLDDQLVSRAS